MIRLKKVLAVTLGAALMVGSLAGCGNNSSKSADGGFDAAQDISVVSREEGSGTRGAFVELTGVEEKDADGNKVDNTTTNAITCNSTEVVLTTVAGDDYAIGYISLGALNDTVRHSRSVELRQVRRTSTMVHTHFQDLSTSLQRMASVMLHRISSTTS